MKTITFKEAKEFSLKKWEYLKDHTDYTERIVEVFPELEELQAECGMCQFFLEQHDYSLSNTSHNDCWRVCPLSINGKDCLSDEHPFNLLKEDNSEEDRELATVLYNMIKNIDVDKFLKENPQFKKLTSTRKSR